MKKRLYLASQSPRRQDLLGQLGVDFHLLLPDANEDVEALEQRRGRETPRQYVQRVCLLKAQAAASRLRRRGLPPGLILCADTTVSLGQKLFGKPADAEEARRTLTRLSARTHRVFPAVVVMEEQETRCALSESRVRFGALSKEMIDAYILTGEPFGKAGSYGIQGRAGAFVERLTGSYTGIMGLPLYETRELLQSFNALP